MMKFWMNYDFKSEHFMIVVAFLTNNTVISPYLAAQMR